MRGKTVLQLKKKEVPVDANDRSERTSKTLHNITVNIDSKIKSTNLSMPVSEEANPTYDSPKNLSPRNA